MCACSGPPSASPDTIPWTVIQYDVRNLTEARGPWGKNFGDVRVRALGPAPLGTWLSFRGTGLVFDGRFSWSPRWCLAEGTERGSVAVVKNGFGNAVENCA
jgi:hypothetical protein